ncbi:hypothetical protein HGP14_09495 [Rhizobium sp. P32RR-XVIII]|uniref:hypothetical protein n=1 Tax=Rhizobium sp. P32RR-XVIII TaxID=2726738 RepID=UPI001456BAE2|nr:hypothetical protein [Rhizobium sp. P32RR-XVIII]NLS03591.1 hypothetical protein [Rhizobium sp. P32RR-XVIII]
MSEKQLEKSEMSSVDFASTALKKHVAPKGSGENVKDRIRIAARRLGWSFTRTKDVWYADPRVSISAEELRVIEEKAGITYARAELREVDELIARANEFIARADALLARPDADRFRPLVNGCKPLVDGIRAFIGAMDRA